MFRKMIPLAVALVIVVGCKKKDTGGGSDPDAAPSGPPITIKLRDEKVGDKVQIVVTKTSTVAQNASGPKGKFSKSQKTVEKAEYMESVLEMVGSDRATKATRAYKVAEKSEDDKAAKSMSYANKTVMIQKKGAGFTYTVNGVALRPDEAQPFREAYEKTDKLKNEDMLPKKAVQVNEKWSLDQVILKKIGTAFDTPISAEKSSGSGRLLKTYTKDGAQWGVIEIKFDVVLDGTQGGIALSGTISMTMTLDTAIDGSTLDGVMKMKGSGKIIGKQAAAGVEVENQIDIDGEETRTTVK